MADCVDILRKGVAQGMSDDEITTLLEKVKKTRRKLAQSNRRVDDMEAALVQEVAKQGERDTLEALYRKRALALQATKRARAVDYVLSNFQGQDMRACLPCWWAAIWHGTALVFPLMPRPQA